MTEVRPTVLAGSWYPATAQDLAAEIDRYLALADPGAAPAGRPMIAVAPHAGYAYSGPVAGAVWGQLSGHRPQRVVILAPNHRHPLVRCAVPTATAFTTPLGEVPLDTAACARLGASAGFTVSDAAHAHEHAVEIQLPFLQRLWPDPPPPIVPVLVPQLDDPVREQAQEILKSICATNTLLVVSTDFTHYGVNYGYVPFDQDIPMALERLDTGAFLKILSGDAAGLLAYGRRTRITMCGLEACALALGCGLPDGYEAALLDYRRSADLNGDFSQSVSYGAILISTGQKESVHA